MKIPHELVTVIEERGKQLLLKVTAQSVGRPFQALIHKPGDLPVICTEFISMPRVKLAVRLLIHGLAMPLWKLWRLFALYQYNYALLLFW